MQFPFSEKSIDADSCSPPPLLADEIVIAQDAFAPLVFVAYIVEVPAETPVTVIEPPVVALKLTFELLLLQVIVEESLDVALKVIESPTFIDADEVLIETLVVVPEELPFAGYVALALAKTLLEQFDPKIFHAYSGWSTNGFLFPCIEVSE